MKKLLLSVLGFVTLNLVYAQQDANFTHYMFNNAYNNPAFVGMKGATNFQLLYRYQYLGHSPNVPEGENYDPTGSPKTGVLSIDHPLLKLKGGVGLNVVSDQFALMRYTSIQLAFSKHIELGKGKLGIGLNGNMNFLGIGDGLRPPDGEESLETDPVLNNGAYNDSYFDLMGGVWYQTDKYFGGFSMSRMLDVAYDFDSLTSNSEGGSKRHMYLTGGYNLELSYSFILTPSLMLKSDLNSTSFEVSAVGTYEKKYWGGINFRQGDALGVLIGMAFLENNALRVGYGIDFVTKGASAKSFTSHEIMLSYSLPPAVIRYKPAVRTPRYQF